MQTINAISKKEVRNAKKLSFKTIMVMIVVLSVLLITSNVFATTPAPALEITFDTEQMFTWAQTIINAIN